MRVSRVWPVATLVACLVALCFQASGGAQQPEPTATGVPDPGLTLQIAQHAATAAGGSAAQQVDLSIGSAYPVQVRLIEDRAALAFDGFTGDLPGTVSRSFPRTCGERHSYDLYAVVGGAVAGSRSATVVLCPEAASTPTPSPTPRPPTPTPAAPATPPPTAAPPPPPPPPPRVAAPSISTSRPGEPPVPAPPLEPPSLALRRGFVLAEPDDQEAAGAAVAGMPLMRVMAIWLRGTDSNDQGDGAYQYVELANLGGAAQDLSGWALQGDSGGISGLTFYFPDGFTLAPGESCRVYVGHPAENTCTDGSFALFRFWSDHGSATLWDDQGSGVDSLAY